MDDLGLVFEILLSELVQGGELRGFWFCFPHVRWADLAWLELLSGVILSEISGKDFKWANVLVVVCVQHIVNQWSLVSSQFCQIVVPPSLHSNTVSLLNFKPIVNF